MPGALSTYAYINAKFRSRISLLLDSDAIRRLESASTFDDLISMLAETVYADHFRQLLLSGNLTLCEIAIRGSEYPVYEEVLRKLEDPPRALVAALARQFEIQNIKAATRIWFERRVRGVPNEGKLGLLQQRPWPKELGADEILHADTYEAVIDLVDSACNSLTYSNVPLPSATEIRESGTLFFLENAIDQRFFMHLDHSIALQSKSDKAVAERLIGFQIDIENVRRFAKLQSFYNLDQDVLARTLIDFSSGRISKNARSGMTNGESLESVISGRFPELKSLLAGSKTVLSQVDLIETVLEEELVRQVQKTLGGPPFTVGIILSYFVLKNLEIRKIIGILNEKRYGQLKPEPER